jgi:hypothetical protein
VGIGPREKFSLPFFFYPKCNVKVERGFFKQVLSYTPLCGLLIAASRSVFAPFSPFKHSLFSHTILPFNLKLGSSVKHFIYNVGKIVKDFNDIVYIFFNENLLNLKYLKTASFTTKIQTISPHSSCNITRTYKVSNPYIILFER